MQRDPNRDKEGAHSERQTSLTLIVAKELSFYKEKLATKQQLFAKDFQPIVCLDKEESLSSDDEENEPRDYIHSVKLSRVDKERIDNKLVKSIITKPCGNPSL